MLRLLLPLALAATLSSSIGLARQAVALDTLLAGAARYTARFVEEFSNVVAEERYLQQVGSNVARLGVRGGAGARRVLRSDFLLLKVGGPLEWRPFRDVFEVDGQPVRDRDERISQLFMQPSATAFEQAARIAQESARYNIGLTRRTLNTPVLSLLFLQSSIQYRFQFTLGKHDASVGPTIWIVDYHERTRPTLIRGLRAEEDIDLPASGRFWIDAETGSVRQTELIVSGGQMRAQITTTFHEDGRFGVAVPVEMTEGYDLQRTRVTGTATYDNFRRFEVTAEAKTGALKEQGVR